MFVTLLIIEALIQFSHAFIQSDDYITCAFTAQGSGSCFKQATISIQTSPSTCTPAFRAVVASYVPSSFKERVSEDESGMCFFNWPKKVTPCFWRAAVDTIVCLSSKSDPSALSSFFLRLLNKLI